MFILIVILFSFSMLLIHCSETGKTFYEILDIDPLSSSEDLLNQFLRLAIENHPNKHDGKNTRKFYSICDAYDYLKVDDRRRDYNAQLNFHDEYSNETSIPRIDGFNYDMKIGIDFGTTHSAVALYDKEKGAIVLENEHGNKVTESVVGFIPGGMILVGDGVWDQCNDIPKRVIYDAKRFVGKSHEVVDSEGLNTIFKYRNRNGFPVFVLHAIKDGDVETEVTPEYVSGLIIEKMRKIAEKNFEEETIFEAVISVPAYYDYAQRSAIKQAAWLGGIYVVDRLIPEPTAAAYAYGIGDGEESKILMSFDFGGGTLDLTLLETNGTNFKVINTAGHNTLGGEDFTNRLTEYLLSKFKSMYPNLVITKGSEYRMKRQAEAAKKFMSSTGFYRFTKGPKSADFPIHLMKDEFLELTKDLYVLVEETISELFVDIDVKKEDVQECILVGGSSKLPGIKKIVRNFFLPNKVKIKRIPNPDEAVAMGAATVIGMNLTEKIHQRYPFGFGIECDRRNEYGKMEYKQYCEIVKKNFEIPVLLKKDFQTVKNNQEFVKVKVFERMKSGKDEKIVFLDEFVMKGITKAPKGTVDVTVEFKILSDGTLNVRAFENKTGTEGFISIENARWKDIDVKRFSREQNLGDEL